MLSSIEFFDRLANGGLADRNQKHRLYRQAIDYIVLDHATRQSPRYLEVGSGDGRRGARLAYSVGAESVTFCDTSPEMAVLAWQYGQVMLTPAEELYSQSDLWGRYDLITCLDTINHIPRFYSAIDGMVKLLAPGGILVFDAMNAYNARVFGWGNVLRDWVSMPRLNSMFSLGGVSTAIRLFIPEEIDSIYVNRSKYEGLDLVQRCFLDTMTGVRRSRWGGDMVYVFKRTSSVGPPANEVD